MVLVLADHGLYLGPRSLYDWGLLGLCVVAIVWDLLDTWLLWRLVHAVAAFERCTGG